MFKLNSIKINKSVSCHINSTVHENKAKRDNKDTEKSTDVSVISGDAVVEYGFLNRIEDSDKNAHKVNFVDKYTSEYKKIKDEIVSGKYGKDTKKYMELLDNAFEDSLKNAAKILEKTLEEANAKQHKIKFSGESLIKYQKQYDTATGITWMLRAENKRISQEIEEYRRKKDHAKVTSLTQLRNTYNNIINNLTGIAAKIRSDIDDNYSEDEIK